MIIFRHPHRRSGPLAGLISVLFLYATSAPATAAENDAVGDAFRLATFGNSLTGTIKLDKLDEFATQAGHRLERSSINAPGAPLDWLWSKQNKAAKKMLDAGPWDGLSLQPFLRSIDDNMAAITEIVDYAITASPDITVYIYAQYTKSDMGDYQDVWRQNVSQYVETGESAPHNDRAMRTRGYYEALTRKVQAQYPQLAVRLVPVGHAFALLDEQIKADMVAGVDDIFELYADSTHVNHTGSFLVGMTYYATLFGESPVGMSPSTYQGERGNPRTPYLPDELVRRMQELAWAATATHPQSGVSAPETPPTIATPLLWPHAVVGEHYRNELDPIFGTRPYHWSLADGELPAGLNLESSGVITGVPSTSGTYDLNVQLRDADGRTDRRQLQLVVEEESAPKIAAERIDLGSVSAGALIRHQLQAEGGNGRLKWAFEGRRGPVAERDGLRISSDGLIVGAVGSEGVHEFPIVVRDADPTTPERDQVTAVLTVTAPGPDVWMVPSVSEFKASWQLMHEERKSEESYDWRARFREQFLQVPAFEPERVVQGDAFDNRVRVHVLRDGNNLRIGVFVQDNAIVVNKDDPSKGDCVEIYQDLFNNRQKVYNSDDRRVIATPDGDKSGLMGGVHSVYVDRTEDGYFIATREPSHSMKRKIEAGAVMGLDIAVHDRDEEDGPISTLMWRGDAVHEEDTSNFGTIIFAPE